MQPATAALPPLPPSGSSPRVAATADVVGAAVASAAVAVAMAITEYGEDGRLDPPVRAWNGAMLGHLAELWLAAPDFGVPSRRSAESTVPPNCAGAPTANISEAAIDLLLNSVLEVAGQVVRAEGN